MQCLCVCTCRQKGFGQGIQGWGLGGRRARWLAVGPVGGHARKETQRKRHRERHTETERYWKSRDTWFHEGRGIQPSCSVASFFEKVIKCMPEGESTWLCFCLMFDFCLFFVSQNKNVFNWSSVTIHIASERRRYAQPTCFLTLHVYFIFLKHNLHRQPFRSHKSPAFYMSWSY